MSDLAQVLDELKQQYGGNSARYGYAFERLMVEFLRHDPVYAEQFDEVWRWDDWPYNGGARDTGIDLVARHRDDGSFTAIQCKFYNENTTIQKRHIDSFFEASGRQFLIDGELRHFNDRLIISSTDKWSANAEAALQSQMIPVQRIGRYNLAESPLKWDVIFAPNELAINLQRKEKFEPRPHQRAAIDNTLRGFEQHDRGQLIMACGTGKTFTALRLAEEFAASNHEHASVLILVPSIALLAQTLREWMAQATVDMRPYAVCSDAKVAKGAEDVSAFDVGIGVSTDGQVIFERFEHGRRAKGLSVIFSTYQSLPAVYDAQQMGLPEFDLVICDEAHRTTGVTLEGEEASNFSKIHDTEYIRAAKRLYMTATPRLFDEKVRDKAASVSAEIASMDDEAVYGPEFHRLGFGEAVERGLLTDYKVLVMTVDEKMSADVLARSGSESLNLSTSSAMLGAWQAFAKRSGGEQGQKYGFEVGATPMQRVVAFARDIKTSKTISEQYPALVDAFRDRIAEVADADMAAAVAEHLRQNLGLRVQAQHVDGTMNALVRGERISWLEATPEHQQVRVLTNARCLSEGVDVPALDAVVFFNPRNSIVDVVQSIGRVMRRSAGKDYGYIVLPVAVPAGQSPSEALADNQRFKVVWQILNALRSHDERFEAKVNSISLNPSDKVELPINVENVSLPTSGKEAERKVNAGDRNATEDATTSPDDARDAGKLTGQDLALFSLEQWQDAMYVRIVDRVGERTYWEDWADDVAEIAQAQITRINSLLDGRDKHLLAEFEAFTQGLRGNLNDSISRDDAISMISQHLITAPVFDALFEGHEFVRNNPVAVVMQQMVDVLNNAGLETETSSLDRFYDSVRLRASQVTSAAGKQQVIKELYERFFKRAFPKQAEALGIVYTPVEIVDFILRAADEAARMHFGHGLTSEGVNIIDPFAGTSTFLVRLLQSGIIEPHDLARKYASELFATEILLLAYYVSAVNIETTYNAMQAEAAKREGASEPAYETFTGIALADTFQVYEKGDGLDESVFVENNASIQRQINAPINVIIGNPPYSVGQNSANDFNQNLKYPSLDQRIEDTYAALSSAQNKNSLYDSYLRAFRWATDRIGNRGIVAFVSNGGWLDGNSGDGVRKSFAEEFTDVYVFNLRGNARTAGDQRRKEAGNVFGSGGRTTIAITIAIKDPSTPGFTLHYRDIGDYLSTPEKLEIIDRSSLHGDDWQELQPNTYGDWLGHRDPNFSTWPALSHKHDSIVKIFKEYSAGLKTSRDAWAYNSNISQLQKNIRETVKYYNFAVQNAPFSNKQPTKTEIDNYLSTLDNRRFSWDAVNIKDISTGKHLDPSLIQFTRSIYRPFFPQWVCFDKTSRLNNRVAQLPRVFPTFRHHNLGIYQVGKGSSVPFSCIATHHLPDLHLTGSGSGGQFFPRFTWSDRATEVDDNGQGAFTFGSEVEHSRYGTIGEVADGYTRVDNIADEIKALYREALGDDITGDDIFHFVYGKLHDPGYRSTYEIDLKKMLPHIETPAMREEFDRFAAAGKALLDLHVNYEDVEPWPVTINLKPTADPDDRETWRVKKMAWGKKRDPETGKRVNDTTTIIVNPKITVTDIPEEAERYQLGSRSALAWLIDRYRVTTDKKSGITNDPNDWADEVGNPRYIVDLIAKVTRVAVETTRIVNGL